VTELSWHNGVFEKLRQLCRHDGNAFGFLGRKVIFFADVTGEVVERERLAGLSRFRFALLAFAFAAALLVRAFNGEAEMPLADDGGVVE